MGLLEHVIIGAIHLLIVGLDIIGFFIVARMLATRWPVQPLQALNELGKPVVDPILAAIQERAPGLAGEASHRGFLLRAVLALLVITGCRLMLGVLEANMW